MQKFTNRAPSFKKKCKISGNHLNLSDTKASEQQWQSHTNNKTTKPEKYEKRNHVHALRHTRSNHLMHRTGKERRKSLLQGKMYRNDKKSDRANEKRTFAHRRADSPSGSPQQRVPPQDEKLPHANAQSKERLSRCKGLPQGKRVQKAGNRLSRCKGLPQSKRVQKAGNRLPRCKGLPQGKRVQESLPEQGRRDVRQAQGRNT